MSTAIVDPVLEPWKFAPDPRSAFGPIISAFEVEHALATCVRRWQRDYLAEVCRQRGLEPEQLPLYRSFVVADTLEKMPEDTPPVLVVVSPGLVPGAGQAISRRGTGAVNASFVIELGSFVSARGNRQAPKLSRLYTAAILALQFGCPLETLRKALCRDVRGNATSPLGVVLDMLARQP